MAVMYSTFKGFSSAQGFKTQGCPGYIFLAVNGAPALAGRMGKEGQRAGVQGHPSLITKTE